MNTLSVTVNLAGFRVKLMPANPERFPRFSVFHAGLLTRGQEDFMLEIRESQNFTGSKNSGMPFRELWTSRIEPPGVFLNGMYPDNRTCKWDMNLDFNNNSGILTTYPPFHIQDPLQYPVDALLIYYLSLFRDALVLHASAVSFGPAGLAFTGSSGAGKSTIARFCQMAGASILHDDRIVLRLSDDKIMAYRMPVYPGNMPRSMELSTVYFINKSKSIYEIPQPKQSAFEKLACHMVQHPFHPTLIQRQIRNLEGIINNLQAFDLGVPFDPEIGCFLAERFKTEGVPGGSYADSINPE
jgi:hypothetical protein